MAGLAALSAKIKLAVGSFPTWDVQVRERGGSDYEAPGPLPLVLTKTDEKDTKPALVYVQDDEPDESSDSEDEIEVSPSLPRPVSLPYGTAVQPVALLLAQTMQPVVVEEEAHTSDFTQEAEIGDAADHSPPEEHKPANVPIPHTDKPVEDPSTDSKETASEEPVLVIRPKPKKTKCVMPEIKEVEDLRETDSFLRKTATEPVIVSVLPVSERTEPKSFEHGKAAEEAPKQCCACVVL